MKKRETFYLAIAVAIFAVLVVFLVTQLGSKSSQNKEVKVEVITPISAQFDDAALKQLTDPSQARNFIPSIDLNSGLGNPTPFTPI